MTWDHLLNMRFPAAKPFEDDKRPDVYSDRSIRPRLPRRPDPRRPGPKPDGLHVKSRIGKRSRKLRKTRRKKCGARVKGSRLIVTRSGNLRVRDPQCQAWALAGKTRCRMHGGASTGPKTPEGKARVVAAMVAGRRKWVERIKAEGRKLPGGPRRRS